MTYEYRCADCKHTFSLSMSVGEHEKRTVECPMCKSTNVRWHPTPFYAKTAKKS